MTSKRPSRRYQDPPFERGFPPPAPGIADCIYEFRVSSGQIAFFDEGRAWQLGGSVFGLQHILNWLGLSSQTSFGPDPGHEEYIEKVQREWDAVVERRRDLRVRDAMQRSHLAWRRGQLETPRSVEELRDYSLRPFMQLDEIELRTSLSPGYPTFLIGPCLPLLVRFDWTDHDQANAYQVLRKFVEALGQQQVHARALLEIAFDYRESLGEQDTRSRWAAVWR